jgi:hypothetical protein
MFQLCILTALNLYWRQCQKETTALINPATSVKIPRRQQLKQSYVSCSPVVAGPQIVCICTDKSCLCFIHSHFYGILITTQDQSFGRKTMSTPCEELTVQKLLTARTAANQN